MNANRNDLPLRHQPLSALIARAQEAREARTTLIGSRTLAKRRIAVVGSYTTSFIVRLLDVFLLDAGVDAVIYDAPYDSLMEQLLVPDSELYRFAPDVVLLLPSQRDIGVWPELLATPSAARERAQHEAERWRGLWRTLAERSRAQIVQSNFDPPAFRALGNFEASVAGSRLAFVRSLNRELAEAHVPGVTLFDLDYLLAQHGYERALEARNYHLSKQPFAFGFLPELCHALSHTLAALAGRARKCAVLDLDGTLWGGTVGEDGLNGIVLGPGSAEGEAFMAFQVYLRALRERGVLLAVCSKNEARNAREVFERHPHMALRQSDIACFVANWQDKAENLVAIADALHIHLDACVFVDNSPEERHRIAQAFPQVAVVDLPEDPAEYVAALDRERYFELSELTAEAASRTQSFVEERQRETVEAQYTDYASYLRSLELTAELLPIRGPQLERCLELIKRTNQFNLRTERHSAPELEALLQRPGSQGFCVSLGDRFGHYGVIAVVVLIRRADALFVDTWLMSCRVLNKGVEQLVFHRVLELAARQGVERIEAEYRATAKNALVAELFPRLGFRSLNRTAETAAFEFVVGRDQAQIEHFIALREVS